MMMYHQTAFLLWPGLHCFEDNYKKKNSLDYQGNGGRVVSTSHHQCLSENQAQRSG